MIISAIVFAWLLGAFIFLICRVPAWHGEPCRSPSSSF